MPEQTNDSATTDQPKPPQSVIWTRLNITLLIIVVLLGAIILASLCFIALLFASPNLRQRVMPFDGAVLLLSFIYIRSL